MNTKQIMKKAIMEEIEKLSDDYVKEILDFVQFLEGKQAQQVKKTDNSDKNPLLNLIGIADVDSFTSNIDEELYGSKENIH